MGVALCQQVPLSVVNCWSRAMFPADTYMIPTELIMFHALHPIFNSADWISEKFQCISCYMLQVTETYDSFSINYLESPITLHYNLHWHYPIINDNYDQCVTIQVLYDAISLHVSNLSFDILWGVKWLCIPIFHCKSSNYTQAWDRHHLILLLIRYVTR